MKGLIETEEEIKIEILKRWHAIKNPEHIHFENLYFKSLKRSHPELTEEQISNFQIGGTIPYRWKTIR